MVNHQNLKHNMNKTNELVVDCSSSNLAVAAKQQYVIKHAA